MADLREEQADFRPYVRAVWRRRWLLAAIVILIPAAVYLLSSLLPKTYEASTTLQARNGSVTSPIFSGQLTLAPPTAQGTVELVETTTVAEKAARELGDPRSEADALLDEVSAAPETEPGSTAAENAQLFTITAQSDSAQRAADVANAFGNAVAKVRTDQAVEAIDQTIDSLNSQAPDEEQNPIAVRELTQQLQQLEALRASQVATTQVIEPASAPTGAASPKPLRNAALGFVFSVLLAGALVPLLQRLDRRVHQAEELQEIVGVSLLAAIPDAAFPGRPATSHVREAFQTLRSSLTYFNVDRSLTNVTVVSPAAGDGKTTVAVNLAIALARADLDIVLVDADLRRSPVASRVGAEGKHGLDSVLLGEHGLEEALEDVDAGGGRLRVLSGGSPPPDPAVLLGSERMRSLLAELGEKSDMVVVDTPALLAVSDAMPLLGQASGIMMVARLEHTTRDALSRSREVISSAGGNLIGVVATGVRRGAAYSYDRYGYGYGYGYGPEVVEGNGAPESDGARAGGIPGALSNVRRRLTGTRDTRD